MRFSLPSPASVLLSFAALTVACQDDPADVHLARAAERVSRSDGAGALTEVKRAIERGAKERADRLQGLALELLSKPAEAEPFLSRALDRVPSDDEVRLARARVLVLGKKLDRAREDLLTLVDHQPDVAGPVQMLATIAETTDHATDARKRLATYETLASGRGAALGAEHHLAISELEARLGNQGAAAAALRLAEGAPAADTARAIALADTNMTLGQLGRAERLFQAALRSAPDDQRTWARLASVALELGHADVAEDALRRVTTEFKADYRVLATRAKLEAMQGRHEQSAASLERAVAALGEDASKAERSRLMFAHAEALLKSEQAEAARTVLVRLVEHDGAFAPARLALASVLIGLRRPAEAVKELKPYSDAHRDEVRAYPILSNAFVALEDLEGAEATSARYVAAAPKDAEAHHLVGQIQLRRGRHAAAKQAQQTALALTPDHEGALLDLTRIVLDREGSAAAMTLLSAQAERAPRAALPHVLLGDLHLRARRFAEADKELLAAAERMPDRTGPWLRLAHLRSDRGELEDALVALDQGLGKNPEAVGLIAEGAKLLSAAGKFQEAAARYERALALSPRFVPALNNLAVLYVDHLDRAADAVPLAERAHQESPDLPQVMETLGWALLSAGGEARTRRAVALLETAAPKLRQAEAYYHLAIALRASGRIADGKRTLERALRADPRFSHADQAKDLLRE